ncbi:DUF4199 family protein [bacterium SCSIO 12643]|nr:DUF4199 family protein [bacterium SCSIO 12643]
MTKSNHYTLLGFILIAFICRLSLESLGIDWSYTWSYLSLLTIVSVYYNMYSQRHNSDETFDFVMDFKGAAQGGAYFAFGTGILTYVFYKLIHPHFLEVFVEERRYEIMESLTANNESQETIDAAIENFGAMAELIYVPGNWSIITTAFLTFLSLFYALIFAGITKFFPKFVNK